MTGSVAEFNFGRLRYDWTDKRVRDFVEALERVNRLAARSPGFVWRMPDDAMEAAQLGPPLSDHRVASTLSVWRSAEDLHDFVYGGLHNAFLKRGGSWFEPHNGPGHVVWCIPEGHRPDAAEALERLDEMTKTGPTETCFDLRWLTERREIA